MPGAGAAAAGAPLPFNRPTFVPAAPPAKTRGPCWLLFLLAAGGLAGPAAADGCPSGGEESAVVVAISPHAELRLADGRLLRLTGFDPALATPAAPDLGEDARSGLAGRLVGKAVQIRLVSRQADRWGRFSAFVHLAETRTMPGGIAAEALAAGQGRYRAEPAAHACRAELLRAEAAARQAKLGLWADPYYGVLTVEDRAAFAERTGTVVVAEGVVTAVQSSPFRTTLRFAVTNQGSRGGHMLVATMSPRILKSFQAQQMDLSQVIGRRVRLRGLLDTRFGPRVELEGPDDIELLDQPNRDQAGRGQAGGGQASRAAPEPPAN